MSVKKKQLQQEYNRRRNAAIVAIAQESGVLDRAALLLSAVHLLISEASVLNDDMEELLGDAGLKTSAILGSAKGMIRAFDEYYRNMSRFISRDNVLKWSEDLEKFDKEFRIFTGLNAEFIPKEVNIEEINKTHGVKFIKAGSDE